MWFPGSINAARSSAILIMLVRCFWRSFVGRAMRSSALPRMAAAASRCSASRRPIPIHRTKPPCLMANGGTGGDGGIASGGGGGGGGDSGDEGGDIDSILSKTGVDADSLPEDVLDALKAGRLGETG